MSHAIPDSFAIMAVDPGGKTGVAAGIFSARPLTGATVKQTLRRAVRKKMIWAMVLGERPEIQAHRLARGWLDFKYRCTVELGIGVRDVYLVVEDFQLRQMAVDLVPVEVTAGLRAIQYHPATFGDYVVEYAGAGAKVPVWIDDAEIAWRRQSASDAMNFATNERMRMWGIWDLGSRRATGDKGDHARAALKHVASGVNKVLEGKWSR